MDPNVGWWIVFGIKALLTYKTLDLLFTMLGFLFCGSCDCGDDE